MEWFGLCLAGYILILVSYYASLQHTRLQTLLGERGLRLGEALGLLSGWGFFAFWVGLWVSPQTRFHLGTPLTPLNALASLPLLTPATWLGVGGVRELGLKVSETHRPVRVVRTGVYASVRHPQYLGGLLGHLGASILLGARDSLLLTPLVVAEVLLLCWWGEGELAREFGAEYRDYQAETPMLLPRI